MTSAKLYISEVKTCGCCPNLIRVPGARTFCEKMDIEVNPWQPPPEWCPLPDKNTYPDEPHDCGHEVFEYAHKKITGRYSK